MVAVDLSQAGSERKNDHVVNRRFERRGHWGDARFHGHVGKCLQLFIFFVCLFEFVLIYPHDTVPLVAQRDRGSPEAPPTPQGPPQTARSCSETEGIEADI